MAKDHYSFHRWFYFHILTPVFRIWFGSHHVMSYPKVPDLPEHFLLICNHVTNLDPFLVGLSLHRHMYFVATEHLFRLGLRSKLITSLADPIPLAKGGNASGAVLEILRRLKAGRSVCLFAEGNCTWDGRTADFPSATGKMIRSSRAPLVTCRIIGGYFAHPRWAYTSRKGPLRCEVTGIYQPEELAKMKPEEINELIRRGIGEDAYERQLEAPQRYPGRRLSFGLERTLLACPKCGKLRSITSADDSFSCSCGLKGSYDEYGMLHGEGFAFQTIRDWEDWQLGFFASLPAPGEEETVYASDDGIILNRVSGHQNHRSAPDTLRATDRGIYFGSQFFPYAGMADVAVRLHGNVTFSMKDGSYYDLKKADKSDYSGRIYKLLFERYAL